MRVRLSPDVANRIGNSPQARPSLRLFTMPGLAGSGQGPFPEAGEGEDLPGAERAVAACRVVTGLVPGVVVGLPDEHCGQSEAEGGEGDARGRTGRVVARTRAASQPVASAVAATAM